MASDSADIDASRLQRRRYIALGAVVLIHLLVGLLLNPIGAPVNDPDPWLYTFLIGMALVAPVLLGMWAALGPGSFIQRVPLVLTALVGISFAGIVKRWNLFFYSLPAHVDHIFGPLLTLCLAAIVMGIARAVRRFSGWQMTSSSATNRGEANRFSAKFLLGWTTAVAILLMIGRALIPEDTTSGFSDWWLFVGEAAAFAGNLLLTLIPAVLLPLVALTRRPGIRLILLIAVLWAGSCWLAAWHVARGMGGPVGEVAMQFAMIQLGAAIVSIVSALILRLGGYRFVRRPRGSDVATPPVA